ncbi:unnamed protein product [Spirodela intermedia]|uniref:Uncharacterized protein n=1 Tax=Spirodela intermedia TaxID=51605 RepID=A0A7I8J8X2_SPIIN|nr:unnamed protein product [Spirodela intermedia]CAA6666235.1 unnamed protein product [Spirodela intermedia]
MENFHQAKQTSHDQDDT